MWCYLLLSLTILQGPLKKKMDGPCCWALAFFIPNLKSSKLYIKKKLETVIAQSSNLVWLFTDKVDEVRMTNALQNSSSRNIYQEQLFVWDKLYMWLDLAVCCLWLQELHTDYVCHHCWQTVTRKWPFSQSQCNSSLEQPWIKQDIESALVQPLSYSSLLQ